jgi:hypothetical protein
MIGPGPFFCIDYEPASNTWYLYGKPVDLTCICKKTNPPIDLGYLSRIFSGKATGSVSTVKQIAEALGMTMEDLMDGLPAKKHAPMKKN